MKKVLLLVIATLAVGCSDEPPISFIAANAPEHSIDITLECHSPDKSRKAIFYFVSGGGAAGFQYQRIAIVETMENDWWSYVAQFKGANDVQLIWEGNKLLKIVSPSSVRIDKQDRLFNGIGISYTQIDRKKREFKASCDS